MSNKLKLPILILLPILGLVIGTATKIYLEKLARPTPQEQIHTAFANLISVSSVSYQANVRITANSTSTTAKSAEFNILASGSIDATDLTNPKSSFALNFVIPSDTGVDGVPAGAIDLEGRAFKKSIYLNIKQMPPIFFDFTPIFNSWIKLDMTEITQQLTQATTTPNFDPAIIEKFREDAKNANILKVTKTFEENHYGWMIDKTNLIAFLPKYEAFLVSLSPNDEVKIKSELASTKVQLESILPTDYPAGEIWITPDTKMISKIQMERAFPASTDSSINYPGGNMIFTLTFTDINKPMNIVEPATSITFQEAFAKLMEEASKTSQK